MKSMEKQMDVLTHDDFSSSDTDSGDSDDDETCGQDKLDQKPSQIKNLPRSKMMKSSKNLMKEFVNRLKIQLLLATKVY